MKYTVLSLFPQLLKPWAEEGLLGRAVKQGLISFALRDLRAYSTDRHRSVDDAPYGGGAGMIIQVDIAAKAIAEAKADTPEPAEVILLTPAGEPFTQQIAAELASKQHLVLLCGRYEGFDARLERYVSREISLGDYVLMGGEVAALALIEATARLLPGVLGDAESHAQDSFSTGLLDYPEYTRPPVFEGASVPEVLLSGHHAQIAAWRQEQALRRTLARRPDLLAHAPLSEAQRRLLAKLKD
ncbi:MAG: tRNA (guanosine(37)-N1)-methyltransferase TrmD [Truepera sp.]|nr:tRNA (guanosine(37)-N1)-methyltransferase TrmD [Truepera sp.]